MATTTIDDFNGQSDGTEPDGWTIHSTGNRFEIDTNIVYEGDACLLIRGDTGSGTRAEGSKYIDAISPDEVQYLFRVNNEGRTGYDARTFILKENDTNIIRIVIATDNGDNDIDFEAGSVTTEFGSTETWYRVRIYNIDWDNNEYDIEVLDTSNSVVWSDTGITFNNDGNEIDEVYVNCKGWGTEAIRFDDIKYIIEEVAGSVVLTDSNSVVLTNNGVKKTTD